MLVSSARLLVRSTMPHLILSVLGPDRPGLVGALSATVRDHHGNWLESRMAKLAGQFAGVVRVDVSEDEVGRLDDALKGLAQQGLVVTVNRDADGTATAGTATPPRQLHVGMLGLDRPGVVRDLAHALAVRGLNITELTSRVRSAPMSGELLFEAQVTLAAPNDADVDGLREQLEQLAEQLDMDLAFETEEA
ncbi:MAG: ACT domain-containing protein [Planctomycetota bacterium]